MQIQDKADKRIKRLSLTAVGREKVAELVDIHNKWLCDIMTCLSVEEQKQFENYCERLLAAAPLVLFSPMNGEVLPLENVEDEVFSGGILGDGIAVEPTEGKLFAPCDGTVENVADTGHAVGITSDSGCEILLHIGIDTVKLNGKYFDIKIKEGQKVSKGDLLIEFDIEKIKEAGYKTTSPVIILNSDDYKIIKTDISTIASNDKILEIE